MNFVVKVMDFALKMVDFVLKMLILMQMEGQPLRESAHHAGGDGEELA